MKSFVAVLLCVFWSVSAYSQSTSTKTIASSEQVWLTYFNQTRVTNKFGWWLDVQYRQTEDFVGRPFQLLLRPALTWFAMDNLRVNAGYAFINHFPPEGRETSQPEHRSWQQLWFNQKLPGVTMLQWFRLEQRFLRKIENDVLVDGYTRGNRIRYNLGFFVPLNKKEITAGTPFAVLSNELFLNVGKNVVYNTFDQNRLFVGLGYQFTAHVNVQLGYLNVYQQQSSGNAYNVAHAIRVALFHNMDLRGE